MQKYKGITVAYRGKDWGKEYTVTQLLEEIEIRLISKNTEKWCIHTNDTVMRHSRDGMLNKFSPNAQGPFLTKRVSAIVRYMLLDEIRIDKGKNKIKTKITSIKSICNLMLNKSYTIDGTWYEEIDDYIDEKLEGVVDKSTHICLNDIINTIRDAMKPIHYEEL